MAATHIEPAPGAQVLVTAERPGPRLWHVSNGEHVLWILGTRSPLPQGMRWRSAEVEEVLGA